MDLPDPKPVSVFTAGRARRGLIGHTILHAGYLTSDDTSCRPLCGATIVTIPRIHHRDMPDLEAFEVLMSTPHCDPCMNCLDILERYIWLRDRAFKWRVGFWVSGNSHGLMHVARSRTDNPSGNLCGARGSASMHPLRGTRLYATASELSSAMPENHRRMLCLNCRDALDELTERR